MQRLLGAAVLGQVEASEAEVEAYFREHLAELRVPEKV